MIVQLFKPNFENKRFMVILGDGREVHFGDDRYQNYTIHKYEGRKRLYILCHQKNEIWNDTKTAGF